MPSPRIAAVVVTGTLALVAALSFVWLGRPTTAPTPPATEVASAAGSPRYFCARTETLRDQLRTAPWPDRQIRWTVSAAGQSRLDAGRVKDAFAAAWAAWADGIDIEPVYQPGEHGAHVVSRFGAIDGSGKVLAWSELSDGTRTPKHQLYDSGESWDTHAGTGTAIDLQRVAAHEIGHVLGLVHDDESTPALMAPMYSQSIRGPTARDTDRLLLIGYQRRKSDSVPAGTEGRVRLEVDSAAIAEALRRQGWSVQPPKP